MKSRGTLVVFVTCALASLACAGGDTSDNEGGSEVLIEDARASCDPTQSAFDDVFIFEVETVSGVDSVDVDVYVGSTLTGNVNLSERGGGNWYAEEEADDLDADCDDFSSMFFEVFAEAGSDSDSVEINP